MRMKHILILLLVTIGILAIPLIAMQVTSEVNWSPLDFLIAGMLLFGAGVTYKLVAGKFGSRAYRVAVGIGIAAVLLIVWAELAVGIVG